MSKKQSPNYFAGLDIGGSTIKAMLVDASGTRIGDPVEVPSYVKKGYKATFEQLKLALKLLCKQVGKPQKSIAAVGIDVPAPCNNGVVWGQSNLAKDWVGTDIRAEFSKAIRKPAFLTNDCNAAAYGECLLRSATATGLLLVAPGTGLGGGLVLPGGTIFEGANGLAMELGDISVPFRENGKLPIDGKGRSGTLEAWVSLIAIRRQLAAKLATARHRKHPLNRQDSTIEKKAFQLRDFALAGDALAVGIFTRQAEILGYALGDLASAFDPGLIAIGGGLADSGIRDWYLETVRDAFVKRACPFYRRSPIDPNITTTSIEWAIGGDNAAAFGVANKARDLV